MSKKHKTMWGTKKVNGAAATKLKGDGRTNYTQLTQMAYQIPMTGRKIYDDTSEYQMMSRRSRERPKTRSSME
jgi:hypothetical protein